MRRIICTILFRLHFYQAAHDLDPDQAAHLLYQDIQKIKARSREAWELKEMQWRTGK